MPTMTANISGTVTTVTEAAVQFHVKGNGRDEIIWVRGPVKRRAYRSGCKCALVYPVIYRLLKGRLRAQYREVRLMVPEVVLCGCDGKLVE